MSEVAWVSIAVSALGVLLAAGLFVVDHRLHKLEDYCDKQRESFARLRDSDTVHEFEEWRKRWNVS